MKLQIGIGEDDYLKYLKAIPAEKTHAGYFSIDKKGKMIDSKVARRETTTDDVDAYDLIMKNKELLLDRNPNKSPVRFIFLILLCVKVGTIQMYFRFVL